MTKASPKLVGRITYSARVLVRHKGCWGSNLMVDPHIRDVTFWAGQKIDHRLVLGSMTVRSENEIDVMAYNPYDLEFSSLEENRLGERLWQYSVDFIIRDDGGQTIADLLFRSGCFLDPPVLVKSDFELQTVLAPHWNNLRRLVQILGEKKDRDFRILSTREQEPNQQVSSSLAWRKALTPKQLEAVRIAFQHGYYGYPRNIRVSDLAREAGLARSTFQEHLRLAEVKLIGHLLESEKMDVDVSPIERALHDMARRCAIPERIR